VKDTVPELAFIVCVVPLNVTDILDIDPPYYCAADTETGKLSPTCTVDG